MRNNVRRLVVAEKTRNKRGQLSCPRKVSAKVARTTKAQAEEKILLRKKVKV